MARRQSREDPCQSLVTSIATKAATKIRILTGLTVAYGVCTFVLSFFVLPFLSEGKTFAAVLADVDGLAAIIQLALSVGIVAGGIALMMGWESAAMVVRGLLFFTVVNIVVSMVASNRFSLLELLNPFLLVPLILFILLKVSVPPPEK